MKNYIFHTSTNSDDCATIGWQNSDQALWGVKEGFINSANDLVDKVLQESKKNDVRILDTYIFPIMYLYRQSLEVSLKLIYYRSFGEIPSGGHNLSVIWNKIYQKIILGCIKNEEFLDQIKQNKNKFYKFSLEGLDFEKIKQVFIEIQKFDVKADVFRYMVDRNGNTYFDNNQYIIYTDLKTLMNEIYQVLDFIYEVMDEYLSNSSC